jgi:organic hydroperoxide reductase OsmC/OhrA
MSQHVVRLEWNAAEHPSQPGTYNRNHRAIISPQVSIPVSAAAEFLGDNALADPEQLLVSAVASCHMLYFLAICEGSGYSVEHYEDDALGEVSKAPEGFQWVSSIKLRPRASFGAQKQPNPETLARLHQRAHRGCFIANSIKSSVSVEPR